MAINDTQYREWLESDGEYRTLLIEANYYEGSEQTEYMSNIGHITKPTDTVANTEYEDVVKSIPVFRRSLGKNLTGQTKQAYGDIEVDNSDGERDDWLDRSWNGRDITMRLGDPAWDYDDFRIMMKGTIAELTAKNPNTLVIKLKDKGVFLDKKVQENVFSSGPNIDKPIPLCYGEVYKIAPPVEDGATHTYQISDSAVDFLLDTYDQGVVLSPTFDGPNGQVILSAQPAGQITVDAKVLPILAINGEQAVSFNNCLYSEDYSQADWVKDNITQQAAAILSPDNLVAGTLIYPTITGTTCGLRQEGANTTSDDGIASIFIKYSGVPWVRIFSPEDTSPSGYMYINTQTGEVGTSVGLTSSWGVDYYGDGWYRIYTHFLTGGTYTPTIDINLVDEDGGTTVTKSGTDGIYVFGAQLETVPIMNGYFKTTTVADGGGFDTNGDIASIIVNILLRGDLTIADIDTGSFESFRLKHPQLTGIFLSGQETFRNAIDTLLESVAGFWGFNRLGKLTLGQVVGPDTYQTELIIPSDEIVENGFAIKNRILPQYRINLGYKRNWRVQTPTELAGSISEDDAALLANEYITDISEDLTVLTEHLLATESSLQPTLLVDATEAGDEADRRLALRDVTRTIYSIDTFATPLTINLGDTITIDYNRFGFSGGQQVIVVGYSESINPPKVKLEVWR